MADQANDASPAFISKAIIGFELNLVYMCLWFLDQSIL